MPVAIALLLIAATLLIANRAQASNAGASGVSGNGFAANNPLNLRYIAPPDNFNGQTGQTAQGIGVYDSLQNGLRAAYLQLTEYYESGLTTITEIVTKWAPPSENPTAQYIANVSGWTGLDANATLSWPGDAADLILAMAQEENGTNGGLTTTSIDNYLQNAGVYDT